MLPDPGFQGLSSCSSTAIVLPPLSSLLVKGGSWAGEAAGKLPPIPGTSPPVPRTVCHRLVVVVTLDDNGWRASTLFPTEQGATARGVRRAAMSGITGMSHQTNATACRDFSVTRKVIAPCVDSALHPATTRR
jgi:hypothetical protein